MDSALSSIQVDTLIDENDGDLSIGDISLREALANIEEGGTITFAQSLEDDDVGAGRGVIALQEGQLVVDKSLSIEGLGADQLTVNGGGKSRVFVVKDEATISGLTISGGIASNGSEEDRFDGGAILATGTGFELKIANSVITGNSSGIGSMTDSVYNTAISALTVENSVIDNNEGDGISPFFGKITITASSISNNLGNGVEGISFYGGGEVTIADSTIANNAGDAVVADGVFNSGIVTITGSTISGNGGAAAIATGGFRFAAGVIDITNSSITDNKIGLSAPSRITIESSIISGNEDSAVSTYNATVNNSSITSNSSVGITGTFISVENSTIAQNTGGGIASRSSNLFPYYGSRLTINNSTISGNGGPEATVGGIDSDVRFSSRLKITNATITNNIGTEVGGILFEEAIPDRFDNSTQIEVTNTIIANNQGPTTDLVANNFNSKGFNLIGDGTDAVGFARTDIVGTRSNPIDPQLGTLQNNGGPTLTQAPLSGSIVIDAGNLSISGSGFDQRGDGFNRVADGRGGGRVQIDIGAVEFSDSDVTPPPTDGFQVLDGDGRRNRLFGAGGRDRINGFAGPDRLKGRGGNDILTGGDGKDTLLGDGGDDILSGGLGRDRLKGGGGKDTFLYEGLDEGKDVILDFKVGQDLIDLSTIFDSAPYNSATPFEDYIRLGKIGRNTRLEVLNIIDSSGGQDVFQELAIVRNVAPEALEESSFAL